MPRIQLTKWTAHPLVLLLVSASLSILGYLAVAGLRLYTGTIVRQSYEIQSLKSKVAELSSRIAALEADSSDVRLLKARADTSEAQTARLEQYLLQILDRRETKGDKR